MKYLLFILLAVLMGCGSAPAAVLVFSDNGSYSGAFTNISTANAAPGVKRVVVTTPQTMTGNVTLATDRAWKFEKNAVITTTGYTFNANGAPFEAGSYQVFTGTGTVSNLLEADPVWFGAKGDNATDDTTAFNQAFAAAPIVNTYNTGSTYLVTSITGITTGTTWRGIGWPKVKRSTSTGYLVTAFSSKSKIEITGIDFDGNNTAANSFILAVGNSCSNINIHNNRFKYGNMGLYVSATPASAPTDIKFKHNYVEDCAYGAYLSALNFSQIINNTFKAVDTVTNKLLYGVVLIGSTGTSVTGNTILGNSTFTVSGVSSQIDASTGLTANTDNTISNNTISGILEEGISFDESAASIKFSGTATAGGVATLTDSGAAFTSMTGYYVVVVAGTGKGQYRYIASNTGTVLTVSPGWNVLPDSTSQYFVGSIQRDNKIIGNTLRNIKREGILLYGANINNLIANNTLTACNTVAGSANACIGVRGVNLAAGPSPAFHNIVKGNTISDATNVNGVYVDVYNAVSPGTRTSWRSIGNVVAGNTIGNNCVYGIRLNNATGNIVSGNNLHNCVNGIRSDDQSVAGNIFSENQFSGVGTNYSNFSQVEQYGVDQPYAFTSIPTQGAWTKGWRVYTTTPTASTTPGWVNIKAVATTMRIAAATGDTILEVGSTTGIAAGDGIGVVLDDWSTHWTTVASVTDGDTLVLTAAIPASRTAPIGRSVNTFLFKTMAALGA